MIDDAKLIERLRDPDQESDQIGRDCIKAADRLAALSTNNRELRVELIARIKEDANAMSARLKSAASINDGDDAKLIERLRERCHCNPDNPCMAEDDCQLDRQAADRLAELSARNFYLEAEVARLTGEIKGMATGAATQADSSEAVYPSPTR